MQFAVDPHRGDLIDVAQYILRYGQRGLGDDLRPPCHCEVCRQVMRPRAGLTPNSHGHFAHLRGARPCPTQTPAGQPYLELEPADPDPAQAAVLRAEFLRLWPQALAWLRFTVPFISPKELDEALHIAAMVRLWEHRHLQAWQVPACLLVLRDYTPAESIQVGRVPQRKMYFRHWFAADARSLGDLWIRRPTTVALVQGIYQPPTGRRKRPGQDELVRTKSHLVTPDLSVEVDRPMSLPLTKWFDDIRNKHLP